MFGKNAMRRSVLVKIKAKAKGGVRRKKAFAGLLGLFMLALLLFAFGTIPESWGNFRHRVILRDVARMAKFDVTIVAPDAFERPVGGFDFEHVFLYEAESKTLYFQIRNQGETDILCTPHMDGGIEYMVMLLEGETSQFLVKAGESVDFAVVIFGKGLNTDGTDATLSIDIQQAGG